LIDFPFIFDKVRWKEKVKENTLIRTPLMWLVNNTLKIEYRYNIKFYFHKKIYAKLIISWTPR